MLFRSMRRNFPVYFRLFSRRNNSFLQSDGRRNYGKSNKGICRSRTVRPSDDMQTIKKNDNRTIDSAYILHCRPYRCDIFLTRKASNKGIFFTKSPGFSPKSICLPEASPVPCVSFYFLDTYTTLYYIVYKKFLEKDTQCHTEQTCLRFSEC